MSTIHASVYRPNNRFELTQLRQDANHFVVAMSMRNVDHRGFTPVPLPLHESLFTDEQMQKVQDALDILEQVYETQYAGHEASVAGAIDATAQAVRARAVLDQTTRQHAIVSADLNEKQAAAMQLAEHTDAMTAAAEQKTAEFEALSANFETMKIMEQQLAASVAARRAELESLATQEKTDGTE